MALEFLFVVALLLAACVLGAALADYVIAPLLEWLEKRAP